MTQSKIYIGNLSYQTTEDSLRDAFGQFGDITDAIIIKDRDTGRSKGFGFITFDTPAAVESATAEMNGKELDGRAVRVSVAQEKSRDGGRGGRGGRGGDDRGGW